VKSAIVVADNLLGLNKVSPLAVKLLKYDSTVLSIAADAVMFESVSSCVINTSSPGFPVAYPVMSISLTCASLLVPPLIIRA